MATRSRSAASEVPRCTGLLGLGEALAKRKKDAHCCAPFPTGPQSGGRGVQFLFAPLEQGGLFAGVEHQAQRHGADAGDAVEAGQLLQLVDAGVDFSVFGAEHDHAVAVDQHLAFRQAHDEEVGLKGQRALGLDIGAAADGERVEGR